MTGRERRGRFFCEYEAPGRGGDPPGRLLAEIPCDRVTAVREVLARDFTGSRI